MSRVRDHKDTYVHHQPKEIGNRETGNENMTGFMAGPSVQPLLKNKTKIGKNIVYE
jgi:hypothetical protein